MSKACAFLIASALSGWLAAPAPGWQAETSSKQIISVAATGKVTAKADLAIVFLSTRSSAPLAADALGQNNRKVDEILARLKSLGYKEDQVKLSGNRFAPAGGAVYYPGRERPTGFDVYNNIYIHIDAPDLKNISELNTRLGLLLDELSKIGASPMNMPISSYSMGGASVVAFTIKDAAPLEKQAIAQAVEKARPMAEEIARRMKVQISGVESVSWTGNMRPMMSGPGNPLDEIPYEYLSSSVEEVPVRVRVDVRYACK